MLVAGAAGVIGGLLLASLWDPLIWLSLAGLAVFVAGFAAAFFRSPRRAGGVPTGPQRHFWRDRYIEYEPRSSGAMGRVKRFFRRR
jgi:hypothetical protein